jgi:hypothetical protein
MTDMGELDELEPLADDIPPPPPSGGAPAGATPVVMASGLPTPFYNPNASKEYYRILFAGVLITLGCLMPFGPEWTMNGYKTLVGGIMLLIGLGIVWCMWGAIHIGRPPSIKWFGLFPLVPVVWGVMQILGAWDAPAVKAFQGPIVQDWGELFSALVSRDSAQFEKVGNFMRQWGAGKVFVFLGGVLAELYFFLGILGGAKAMKQQKAAGAARRRR